MSEEMIIKYCSPTLAGLKTGSMFVCEYGSRNDLRDEIREYNKVLVPKGIRLIPLRSKNRKALIYVYRPSKLKRDLTDAKAAGVLKERGYPSSCCSQCVHCLKNHLNEHEAFPHEIGLFLGYPPDDVIGFIDNKAGNYKYCGMWKVYGDLQNAKKTFEKFKKCTGTFEQRYQKGAALGDLAVAG